MSRVLVTSMSRAARSNRAFRRVIATGKKLQVVLMTLRPGEEIGSEVHPQTDQYLRVESGYATAIIGRSRHRMGPGDAVLVPSGTRHNVINTGRGPLRISTLYAPPEHGAHTVTPSPQMRRANPVRPHPRRRETRR